MEWKFVFMMQRYARMKLHQDFLELHLRTSTFITAQLSRSIPFKYNVKIYMSISILPLSHKYSLLHYFTWTFYLLQILSTDAPVIENIDVTITGRSSTTLIIQHDSSKRRLACSTQDLLEELSSKLPCKHTITVESNIITAYKR